METYLSLGFFVKFINSFKFEENLVGFFNKIFGSVANDPFSVDWRFDYFDILLINLVLNSNFLLLTAKIVFTPFNGKLFLSFEDSRPFPLILSKIFIDNFQITLSILINVERIRISKYALKSIIWNSSTGWYLPGSFWSM